MISKEQANYRETDNVLKVCGFCAMFRLPHRCTLVEGFIYSCDICDHWSIWKGAISREGK